MLAHVIRRATRITPILPTTISMAVSTFSTHKLFPFHPETAVITSSIVHSLPYRSVCARGVPSSQEHYPVRYAMLAHPSTYFLHIIYSVYSLVIILYGDIFFPNIVFSLFMFGLKSRRHFRSQLTAKPADINPCYTTS